eukprot:scaffold92027_cov26-Tisochrysis_lutea.AAC.6
MPRRQARARAVHEPPRRHLPPRWLARHRPSRGPGTARVTDVAHNARGARRLQLHSPLVDGHSGIKGKDAASGSLQDVGATKRAQLEGERAEAEIGTSGDAGAGT